MTVWRAVVRYERDAPRERKIAVLREGVYEVLSELAELGLDPVELEDVVERALDDVADDRVRAAT
jgi:hypothetical protein